MASFTPTDNITNAIGHIDRAIGIVDVELAKNNAILNTPSTSASTSASTGPQTIVAVANATPIKINVLLSFANTNGGNNDKCRIVNEKPTQLPQNKKGKNWVFLELEYDRNTSKIATKKFVSQPTIENPSQTVTNVTIKDTDADTIVQCIDSTIDPANKFFTIENDHLKIKPIYVEKNGDVFNHVDSATDSLKTLKITPDVQTGVTGLLSSTPTKLKLSFDDELKFESSHNITFMDGSTTFTSNGSTVTNLNTALEKIKILDNVLSTTKGGAKSKTKKGGRGRRRYKTKRR
jgi:hypothetical protein